MNLKVEQMRSELEYVLENCTFRLNEPCIMSQKADAFLALMRKGLSPDEAVNETGCTPIYECQACFARFTSMEQTNQEYRNGQCPCCGYEDLKIIAEKEHDNRASNEAK